VSAAHATNLLLGAMASERLRFINTTNPIAVVIGGTDRNHQKKSSMKLW